MNVTLNSIALATELRLLNKIVPTNPSIAVLSHVLLTASDELRFYATDLEVGLSTNCPARVGAEGSVALPVGRLLSMVEQFMDSDVNIAVEGPHVMVRCGAFKARLQAHPVIEFPPEPEPEGVVHEFNGPMLRQLITRTRYAVAPTSQKHVLQGALLTTNGTTAAMVATDGTRLTLATTQCAAPPLRIIIPSKTLDAVAGQSGDLTEMQISARHLFFKSNGRMLSSRTIEGTFPSYEKIIPRQNTKIAAVGRTSFAAALRRVLTAAETNAAVYLTIKPGVMDLSSASAEVGAADEQMAIGYEGEELKVCINGTYVLKFLEAAEGQTITLALKDKMSAALLTDGNNYIDVIMLMRR